MGFWVYVGDSSNASDSNEGCSIRFLLYIIVVWVLYGVVRLGWYFLEPHVRPYMPTLLTWSYYVGVTVALGVVGWFLNLVVRAINENHAEHLEMERQKAAKKTKPPVVTPVKLKRIKKKYPNKLKIVRDDDEQYGG